MTSDGIFPNDLAVRRLPVVTARGWPLRCMLWLRNHHIVSAAHGATPKLVHRDLKPSNILVERRPDGKTVLRVTDFGIGGLAAEQVLERSRSSSLQENMASVLTGAYSPLYASPQQMRGERPDPRDDVYALGVIWYQLLTSDLTSPAPTGRRWVDALQRPGH
jgi:serine/threonine protein kinase